jgi:hypothetical protein
MIPSACSWRSTRMRLANGSRMTRDRNAIVSAPHKRQMPRSRANTQSRRYDVLDRSRHSWTHASEQNVRRRPVTIPLHHRQFTPPLPPSPLW